MKVVYVGCFLCHLLEFYKEDKGSCKNRMRSSALQKRLVSEYFIPEKFMISDGPNATDIKERDKGREKY